MESKIVRKSVEIASRKLPRAPKTSPRELKRPTWLPRSPQKTFKSTSDERRRSPRAPKRSSRWFLGLREAPKRPPRAPQRSQRGPQQTPKSAQKRPKSALKRFQDHLRIENGDFSKIELPPRRELDF